MTVPTLERATARLLHVSTPLFLFAAPQRGAPLIVMALLCPAIFLEPPIRVRICNRVLLCAWVFRGLSDSSSSRDPFALGARTRLVNTLPSHNPAILVLTTVLVMLQCDWLRMTIFLLFRVCD